MQSAYIVPLYYNSTDCQLVPFLHMVSIYAEDIIVPYALYSQLIESCKDMLGSLLQWHFLNEQEFIHEKSDPCGKFPVV